MIDVDLAREDITRATKAAGAAASYWAGLHRNELQQIHEGTQAVLNVQAAITYLVSKGLITVAGPEAFEGWTVNIPEPFAADLAAAVAAGG